MIHGECRLYQVRDAVLPVPGAAPRGIRRLTGSATTRRSRSSLDSSTSARRRFGRGFRSSRRRSTSTSSLRPRSRRWTTSSGGRGWRRSVAALLAGIAARADRRRRRGHALDGRAVARSPGPGDERASVEAVLVRPHEAAGTEGYLAADGSGSVVRIALRAARPRAGDRAHPRGHRGCAADAAAGARARRARRRQPALPHRAARRASPRRRRRDDAELGRGSDPGPYRHVAHSRPRVGCAPCRCSATGSLSSMRPRFSMRPTHGRCGARSGRSASSSRSTAPVGPQFRHALIRDAAYEGLPFRRRQQLHAQVGDSILRAAGDHPEEQAELLAVHYWHARRWEEAWRFSRIAGDHAREIYANVEAGALLRAGAGGSEAPG